MSQEPRCAVSSLFIRAMEELCMIYNTMQPNRLKVEQNKAEEEEEVTVPVSSVRKHRDVSSVPACSFHSLHPRRTEISQSRLSNSPRYQQNILTDNVGNEIWTQRQKMKKEKGIYFHNSGLNKRTLLSRSDRMKRCRVEENGAEEKE